MDRRIAGCSTIADGKGETAKDRAMAHYKMASAFAIKGDRHRAIAEFTESIKLAPEYIARAYVQRGILYAIDREYDLAIADYSEAIRVDPKRADSYLNRGRAYVAKGDRDYAIADYADAIRNNPKFAEAYGNLCNALTIEGRLQPALASCNKSVQLKPRNPASLAFRGTVYLALRNFKRAKANYEEALALDPHWSHALFGRGLMKIKLGDTAGGNADIAAAKNYGIDTAAEFGIKR
jgi:tetratricopeptide (TPR) repeat protein